MSGGATGRHGGLLPDDIARTLPRPYATEHEEDPEAKVKWFTPWTNWTWHAIEYDGKDRCFGLVSGHETELGYFLLSELAAVRGPGGLKIQRDEHFTPTRVSVLLDRHR